MMFFCQVEETFTVPGRGCVIVPAMPPSDLDFRLHARDSIQLRNPSGQVLDTYIASIEMVCGPAVDRMAFLLPGNVSKFDIPKGTEIWLSDSALTTSLS